MRVVKLGRFIDEIEPVNWLVETLLPDVGWTLFVGPKGLGKTTLSLQLCCALQAGTPFLGLETKQTNILFIQADSPTTEWRAIARRIVGGASDGLTVVDVPAKCLNNPEYTMWIGEMVKKYKPGFVVFDSLYNLTSSSISTEAVLIPINMMKAICNGVPFLVIHHPPQNETRAAGHHSLAANCSNEWFLLKTKMRIDKCRLSSIKEIAIQRDSQGLWQRKPDEPANRQIDVIWDKPFE